MATPNTPDHTGITQPLDQIVAIIANATPEERIAMLAKINQATSATHQDIATTVSSTPSSAASTIQPEPLSPVQQRDLSQELLDTTSAQYDQAYQNWKATFELPTRYLSTLAKKDDVMKWAATVPQETIQALQKYGPARLKLLTEMPVPYLLEVLNRHPTIPGQNKSVIWWDQWKTVAAKPGEFGLTPDVEDMPQEDIYQGRKNPAIVTEYKRRFEQTPLTSIMPQAAYLPSAMDSMVRGQVYDKKYWTGFEQPQGTDYVPYAHRSGGRVRLGGDFPVDSRGVLRGRLWVSPEKKV